MFYLVEAKEVLDGGGCVEDVTFSRHHQHEAIQRLKAKEKTLLRALRRLLILKNTKLPTCSSRSPSEKVTPSREVTCEGEEEAEAAVVVEEEGSAFWTFPPNIRLRSLFQLEPLWPFFMEAGGKNDDEDLRNLKNHKVKNSCMNLYEPICIAIY